jgi:hypothetical protein
MHWLAKSSVFFLAFYLASCQNQNDNATKVEFRFRRDAPLATTLKANDPNMILDVTPSRATQGTTQLPVTGKVEIIAIHEEIEKEVVVVSDRKKRQDPGFETTKAPIASTKSLPKITEAGTYSTTGLPLPQGPNARYGEAPVPQNDQPIMVDPMPQNIQPVFETTPRVEIERAQTTPIPFPPAQDFPRATEAETYSTTGLPLPKGPIARYGEAPQNDQPMIIDPVAVFPSATSTQGYSDTTQRSANSETEKVEGTPTASGVEGTTGSPDGLSRSRRHHKSGELHHHHH